MIHEDNIHGKPTIFIAMGSQHPDAKERVEHYKALHDNDEFNIIIIPFDINGSESGDNYEIYAYYENVLGVEFYVTEKIDITHRFIKDFGAPKNNFTEYHFDSATKFTEMKVYE